MTKLLFILLIFILNNSFGQITPDLALRFREADSSIQDYEFTYRVGASHFYQLNNNKLAWVGKDNSGVRNDLCSIFSYAKQLALKDDKFTNSYCKQQELQLSSLDDSIKLDMKITNAAILFLKNLRFGNAPPEFSYKRVSYQPDYIQIAELLAQYYHQNKLKELLVHVEPTALEYANAKKLFNQFQQISDQKQFSEIVVTSTEIDNKNLQLLNKLIQLGIIKSKGNINQNELVQKVQQAQKLFNIPPSGLLDQSTLKAINLPLKNRLEELRNAIDNIKWIGEKRKTNIVGIVNIPSANLYVYQNDTLAIYSKVIVGKPSTKTPTLSSKVAEVVIYPYWNVPQKIARRELLPAIKRNIGYLERNNFQVLNSDGKLMNPYSIRWRRLSSNWFPYTLRQSTGCDNSLGILKFNFNNPFTVYLHDTPKKDAFNLSKRFLSHGCVRVEKPIELARLLMDTEANSLDSLTYQCLKNQEPKIIPLIKPMDIIILYNTAWFNQDGEIIFYEDVYSKNQMKP